MFYRRLTRILILSGALLATISTGQAYSQPTPEPARKSSGSDSRAGQPEGAGTDKPLPFPAVAEADINSLAGVKFLHGRKFPSAIDIKGVSKGLLLHARKDTRYDLLSSVALWLESGALLVSVRAPSQTALVASRFGDVCVTTGGDALVERGEGIMRVVNLGGVGAGGDSVCLVLHDKQWRNSPWAHLSKVHEMTAKSKKGKAPAANAGIDSGVIAISPGYELVVGDHGLDVAEVKPPDSIGRRDFKLMEGGKFAVAEINVDNLVQIHDLVKNLKDHGEKASGVLTEISRVAAQFKTRQGEDGFEKVFPPPPPKPEVVKRDPKKPGIKPPVATTPKNNKPQDKPKGPQQAGTDTPPGPAPAPAGKSQIQPPPLATGSGTQQGSTK